MTYVYCINLRTNIIYRVIRAVVDGETWYIIPVSRTKVRPMTPGDFERVYEIIKL